MIIEYECAICEHEFEAPAYEEGVCPKCKAEFILEDDCEGRCLPIWENDFRYPESYKNVSQRDE